jgi:S-(hydroxymethyl)glutathione dehydrogenase/alcohol dehydrogenase
MQDDTAGVSRRGLLTQGAVAGTLVMAAQSAQAAPASPAVRTVKRFRGWVARTGAGPAKLEELKLNPISGRQVLVRTEASNLDSNFAVQVLGIQPKFPRPPPGAGAAPPPRATLPGHGGIGIVEAVGPDVRRVKVGDRVCVSGTPQCGECYACIRARADQCQWNFHRADPSYPFSFAETADGTPVYQSSHIGGMAEYMVTYDEWVVPLFTKAPAAELGMTLGCTVVAGLGSTVSQGVAVLPPGGVVAIVGCGPIGLAAVQGARIAGASTIIAIDPIRARREVALATGATHALDPNAEGNKLIQRVRDLSIIARGPRDRLFSGGGEVDVNNGDAFNVAGADFVVEGAGFEAVEPRVEKSPDPTGLLAIRQAYLMCSSIGYVITNGLPRGEVTLPATAFTLGGRTHIGGQAGGLSPLRDLPTFARLLESGQFNPKPLMSHVVRLEDAQGAMESLAYKTSIAAVIVPA